MLYMNAIKFFSLIFHLTMNGHKTNYLSEPCSCIAVKVLLCLTTTSKDRGVGQGETNEKSPKHNSFQVLKQKRFCDWTEIPAKSMRKLRKREKIKRQKNLKVQDRITNFNIFHFTTKKNILSVFKSVCKVNYVK